jgi:hypothetical protein
LLEEGLNLFKKFNSNYHSLKQPVFNPFSEECGSIERCGYGLRRCHLERSLQRLEFRNKAKTESTVSIQQILRVVIPPTTQ